MKLQNPDKSASFSCFQKQVQSVAHAITANGNAGKTADECKFIHCYYVSNQRQSLRTAIAQCACSMLELFRASELKRITLEGMGYPTTRL